MLDGKLVILVEIGVGAGVGGDVGTAVGREVGAGVERGFGPREVEHTSNPQKLCTTFWALKSPPENFSSRP